jgi:hypothetical protein
VLHHAALRCNALRRAALCCIAEHCVATLHTGHCCNCRPDYQADAVKAYLASGVLHAATGSSVPHVATQRTTLQCTTVQRR